MMWGVCRIHALKAVASMVCLQDEWKENETRSKVSHLCRFALFAILRLFILKNWKKPMRKLLVCTLSNPSDIFPFIKYLFLDVFLVFQWDSSEKIVHDMDKTSGTLDTQLATFMIISGRKSKKTSTLTVAAEESRIMSFFVYLHATATNSYQFRRCLNFIYVQSWQQNHRWWSLWIRF